VQDTSVAGNYAAMWAKIGCVQAAENILSAVAQTPHE
jgi:hypothetical protein